MTKKFLIFLVIIAVAGAAWFYFFEDGFNFGPAAEKPGLIKVFTPKPNEIISSPLIIEGEARGYWFFEASFPVRIFDDAGNELGVVPAQAQADWMTTEFVSFKAVLEFKNPTTEKGILVLEKDNPSGLPENDDELRVPILFSANKIQTRIIQLYYYNPEKDKDETGNIKCSRDGLTAIEREIPVTKTPIQDAINLLLKGKENLTEADIAKGIATEYPLEGLSLVGANFKPDGTLILEFSDLQNKTSGGSCRVGILWFQIEATAKQFSGVKKAQFLPEELFQP